MVNLSRRTPSRSAKRRIRRTIKETTGSNIATCFTPLPDEATGDVSQALRDHSPTNISVSVGPSVELSGGVMVPIESSSSSLPIGTTRLPFPDPAMEELFQQFVADRRRTVAAARLVRSLDGCTPDRPGGPQVGCPADVSALERSWALMPPVEISPYVNTWDNDLVLLSTIPDPSNLGETARHASRLLKAFSTGPTPPVAGALTPIQQRLLSTAQSSILAMTADNRVDAALQTDPLPPPPPPVDISMRPDSTCVVCFSRLVDTVLMPCWHLVLCGVCMR